MRKLAIYTAIMGDFDKIKDPEYIIPNADYICFTDNKYAKSNIWNIRYIDSADKSPRFRARMLKVLPHIYLSEYEYTLWVDGNIKFISDINDLLQEYISNKDFLIATFKHPTRTCIYQEFLQCAYNRNDEIENFYKQLKICLDKKYPLNNGLCETNVIFRNNKNQKVQQAMEEWSKYISNTIRDQLSFNLVMHDYNIDYQLIPGNARGNSKYFLCVSHKEKFIKKFYNLIFQFLKKRYS